MNPTTKLTYVAALAVAGVTAAAPLVAQGVAPGARVARNTVSTLRMMVANPYAYNASDSMAAVEIGSSFRQSVQEMVGDDYTVVTREQMNDALNQYGWTPDAILSGPQAVQLAKSIQARIVVTSTLAKSQDGQFSVTARLVGVSDSAGNVSVVAQHPGERFLDFGYRIAEELRPATKSLDDAKACMDQFDSKPDKAVKAAEKAIKKLPNHGLAQYCLYLLARLQKQPAAEATQHLEAASKGDPLSIQVWRELAIAYRDAKDSVNALAAAKQLLRLAPGDQTLREGLFKYLLQSGQTKAALEIADEGLKVDPGNAALYDLKSSACVVLQDFECAAAALERVYAIDSTKVDTLYFAKWVVVASASATPDTAQLLKWAQAGAQKFPDNVTLLRNLHRAYVLTGQTDSSVAVAQRLIAHDTTAVLPAVAAVQALVKAQQAKEAVPFVDFVKRYGRPGQKDTLAMVLVGAALPLLQEDSAAGRKADYAGAADLARTVLELSDSTMPSFQYGNFVLGVALFQQGYAMDDETERQKSCEMARQEQQLMTDAKQALAKVQVDQYKAPATQYLGYIDKFTPRITAMLKSYCR